MKTFEGIVVSNQMKNTVVVEVFRVTPHPLYRKLVKLSKKFKADTVDFGNINVGAVVRITETKPMSKDKYFKVSKVISKGEGLVSVDSEKELEKVMKVTEKKPVKTEEPKTEKRKEKTPKKEPKSK